MMGPDVKRIEVSNMSVGVTNEGCVRLQLGEAGWTDMPPEVARWLATELSAAANRVEKKS